MIPNGHKNEASIKHPNTAKDKKLIIPAVGKKGRTAKQGALKPFTDFLN